MKIKILTFYFADNYGAVLQTYALQGALNKIGCEALVSNYIPSTMQYESKISSLKDLLYFHTKKKIHDRFELFRRKYLNISMDSLSENDVYVAGSDQIWNLDITKNDYTYYLDFNNNDKSFYYAASIGKSDYNDSQFEKVKKYLLRNNNISVREKSFCSSLNKRINDKKINYVLDPTLLHDSNFWRNIELKPKLPNGIDKYVLVYMINFDDNVINIAKKIAKELNIKVLFINNSFKKMFDENVYNVRLVDPSNFIWLFDNSTYVCTNSFHGTCFSILFQKSFCVVPHKERGARMVDLLNDLSLSSCLYSDDFVVSRKINYNIPNLKLDELRDLSYQFIKKSLYKE